MEGWGDELPVTPSPEDIGGWVWERAYLAFSMRVGKELPARQSAIDGYFRNNVQPFVSALEDILEPGDEDHECFAYAMELFVEYERHGYLYPGSYHDQDARDMYILDSIRSARDAAEAFERQKEAHESFLKQQEAQEKAREQDGGGVY